MTHAIDLVIFVILTLAGLVMDVVAFVDGWFASLMTAAHIPQNAQLVLLLVVAVVLVVMAVRALGGIFAGLIVILLLLLLVHQAFPGAQIPQAHLPAGMHVPWQTRNTAI